MPLNNPFNTSSPPIFSPSPPNRPRAVTGSLTAMAARRLAAVTGDAQPGGDTQPGGDVRAGCDNWRRAAWAATRGLAAVTGGARVGCDARTGRHPAWAGRH